MTGGRYMSPKRSDPHPMKLTRACIAGAVFCIVLGTLSSASARITSGGTASLSMGRSIVASSASPLDAAGKIFAAATQQISVEDLHKLRWPVPDTTINTPFTGEHSGVDIEGETGDPIVAAASGSVVFVGDDGDGYGQKIVIEHDDKISTLYSHLQDLKASKGPVQRGEVIGTVGCTGSCSGDHLHFEVLINETPTNPMEYLKN
jgi:murein DD-endopeptidase MepM/ murein hydrolase activator NlpD